MFRFDFAGRGKSDRQFGEVSTRDQAAQTDTLLDSLAAKYPALRWHLMGFSMGALAAALTASQRSDLASLQVLARTNVLKTATTGAAPLAAGSDDFIGLEISPTLLAEAAAFDLAKVLLALQLPTLVLHGERDVVVRTASNWQRRWRTRSARTN